MSYLLALLIATSFVFTSCGIKSNGDREVKWNPEFNPCGQAEKINLLCLPQAKWTVLVFREDFPTNVVLKLNGYSIIDECAGRIEPFSIIRGQITNIIAQKFNYINPDDQLRVEIIDRGSDCLGQKPFYFNENQLFYVETIDDDMYVDIEID